MSPNRAGEEHGDRRGHREEERDRPGQRRHREEHGMRRATLAPEPALDEQHDDERGEPGERDERRDCEPAAARAA